MLKRLGVAAMGWIVFGSLVQAHRDMKHQDDPFVVAMVEADLAHRHCPGLAYDVEQVKRVSLNQQMNHADFFTRPQSARLKAHLAALRKQLHDAPAPTCERLWATYGTPGWRTQLLKRV